MAKQLHKKFSDQHIKFLLERNVNKEIKIYYILDKLGIKRSRFFELLKEYRKDPDDFSFTYRRRRSTRRISKEIEENIIKELRIEKSLIENKNIPVKSYNYSYIRDQLWSPTQKLVQSKI